MGKVCTKTINEDDIKEWLILLSEMGPKTVIVTSVPDSASDKDTYVISYNKEDGRFWKVKCSYIPAYFPGTGDGFTSVVVGSLLKGDSLPMALDRAAQFILSAIRASYGIFLYSLVHMKSFKPRTLFINSMVWNINQM